MRQLSIHVSVCFLGWSLAVTQSAMAVQSSQESIVIPAMAGATIDSQDSDSIDFVLPGGKGKTAIASWLAKFQQAGWAVEVVDQDSMFAEYELTRKGQTLEIELDDPGFDEAEISISCDSDFRLAIEGAPPIKEAVGPILAAAINAAPNQSNAQPGERSLGSVANLEWEVEEDWQRQWWISPNGQRFAYRKRTPTGLTVSVDGSEMGIWDELVSPIEFSPDSQHHAFVAGHKQDGKLWYYLVVDGVPGKPFEKLDDEIAFTADGQQVIFGKEQSEGTSVLMRSVDASQAFIEPGYRFAAHQDFFFRGPQGAIGYVAAISDREDALFYNGKQIGQRYADIDPEQVAVSADGQHIAFFAEISPVRLGLVLDGKVVREHNQFEQGSVIDQTLRLSPNGQRMAWGARLNGKEMMYLDGKSGGGYEVLDFPTFSPDGSRFLYLAMKDGSPLIVIDGVESEKYAMASEPEFSQDGRTIAYYAELNQQEFMVINGQRQTEFDRVTMPLISPDGSIVAYTAVKGEDNFVFVNGAVKAKHSSAGSPYFLPGSNTLVWIAFDEGKGWRIVVDGIDKFAFEDFEGKPAFSPDGQRIAMVTVGGKGASLMIDGKSGAVYDRILAQDGIRARFDAEGNCYYLGVRQDELFLVNAKQ